MRSAITVLNEQIKNFYLIRRLSVYEMKASNNSNYLGVLWEIINPMIQISIYWLVFGYLMTGSHKEVQNVAYFPWLLAGIVVWFFVSPAITSAAKSIYSRLGMVSKMSFPMSVIPTYVIFARLYQHLMLLGISIIILALFGFFPNIYIIQLPYFIFCAVAFLLSLSLILSTLTTIIRDINMLVTSFVRILFYLTPILWFRTGVQNWIMLLMKANPFFYIVQGYRASLLTGSWYIVEHWQYTLYFWALTIVLFIIGSSMHVKFRDRFADFM
jgi:teichoic acid transport system permease protein